MPQERKSKNGKKCFNRTKLKIREVNSACKSEEEVARDWFVSAI
jgi:hypothetical protein